MAILKTMIKSKKIDLTEYFNEEAHVYIKYIKREVWKFANRLTLKLCDTMIYNEIMKNKDYQALQKKIDNSDNKYDYINEQNKLVSILTADIYHKTPEEEIKKSQQIENERNKILIEHGLDSENHNIYDENNNKVIFTFENIQDLPFFDKILNDIITFNSEFDVGK